MGLTVAYPGTQRGVGDLVNQGVNIRSGSFLFGLRNSGRHRGRQGVCRVFMEGVFKPF